MLLGYFITLLFVTVVLQGGPRSLPDRRLNHIYFLSMNVLLTTINSKYIHQNLAIRLLYALNKEYEGLRLHEFTLKNIADEIAEQCMGYDMVAFSCYIWNISRTLEAARRIKQLNPACRILLGGPEVSYGWEELMDKPEVDYIILDEGEVPFAALLRSYPEVGSVPGLVWRRDGAAVKNSAPVLTDLQMLRGVNPYADMADDEILHKISYIESSRGCPNTCGFCLAGLHNKLRYLPEEAIEANLRYLMERGRVIKFLDRTFNTHPDFAIRIFRFIIDHHRPGNVFQFEIKADILQPELIAFIQQEVPKGLFRFEIGIQTLNAESNTEVKRRQNFENIKTFIASISSKVEVHLDLIVGLPHDYMADIRYSFEEVFLLFAPELQLGFLKFLKGTPIREQHAEHGYCFDPQPPYQIISSSYLSADELAAAAHAEHALDMYWNKKRALNTLRYVAQRYSSFDFLHGLGRYWHDKNGRRNCGITEVYIALREYSLVHFPHDVRLQELIALDYYLQHKIKPAAWLLPELGKEQRAETVAEYRLNHHRYRYVMHAVHFSVRKFVHSGLLEDADDLLIVQYSGDALPQIITSKRRG